jgi:hypothetical protein
MIVDHLFNNKKNLQEGVTTENTQDTYNRVYQLMVRQKPEFMYHADNEDVKNAILKAMSFGSQISVNDLATYAYGLLKSNDINEQGVAETSDYSRRREREEDIISGKRPARQRTPAQTSDYARRRAQEKKSEQGVAEGANVDLEEIAQHVYANNTEVPWAVNTATGKNYTVDQLQGVTKRNRFSPSSTSTAPAAPAPTTSAGIPSAYGKTTYSMKPMTGIPGMKPPAAPAAPSVPKAPIIKYNFNLPAGGAAGIKTAPAPKGTKVVSGGPTPYEQAKLARRIAQAAKQPVAEMLAMVETKEDVARIKQFIDKTFIKYGAVTESAFAVRNQLIEHVTQVGAQRRKEHSQRMAK